MSDALKPLEHFLLQQLNTKCSSYTKDPECQEYDGYTCILDSCTIKYRQAKITPKKIGQFVTLWQRNTQGITAPFTTEDPFDFYIIRTEDGDHTGYFLFPRLVLGEKGILTTAKKEGKRGFRLYPDWDTPTNKQALKTQQWQSLYFVDCTQPTAQPTEKVKNIMQQFSNEIKKP